MELIGQKVTHKTYKNGIIKDFRGNIIVVKFDGNDKEMKFLYPDCFKTFLTMENSSAHEKVKVDTAEKAEQETAPEISDDHVIELPVVPFE